MSSCLGELGNNTAQTKSTRQLLGQDATHNPALENAKSIQNRIALSQARQDALLGGGGGVYGAMQNGWWDGDSYRHGQVRPGFTPTGAGAPPPAPPPSGGPPPADPTHKPVVPGPGSPVVPGPARGGSAPPPPDGGAPDDGPPLRSFQPRAPLATADTSGWSWEDHPAVSAGPSGKPITIGAFGDGGGYTFDPLTGKVVPVRGVTWQSVCGGCLTPRTSGPPRHLNPAIRDTRDQEARQWQEQLHPTQRTRSRSPA